MILTEIFLFPEAASDISPDDLIKFIVKISELNLISMPLAVCAFNDEKQTTMLPTDTETVNTLPHDITQALDIMRDCQLKKLNTLVMFTLGDGTDKYCWDEPCMKKHADELGLHTLSFYLGQFQVFDHYDETEPPVCISHCAISLAADGSTGEEDEFIESLKSSNVYGCFIDQLQKMTNASWSISRVIND